MINALQISHTRADTPTAARFHPRSSTGLPLFQQRVLCLSYMYCLLACSSWFGCAHSYAGRLWQTWPNFWFGQAVMKWHTRVQRHCQSLGSFKDCARNVHPQTLNTTHCEANAALSGSVLGPCYLTTAPHPTPSRLSPKAAKDSTCLNQAVCLKQHEQVLPCCTMSPQMTSFRNHLDAEM